MSPEYLAGLLEGEGCFYEHKRCAKGKNYYYPGLKLSMSDRDVVERVADVWGQNVTRIEDHRGHDRKDIFTARQTGVRALETMLGVFPYMGNRRSKKISEVLGLWEHSYGLTTR